MPPGSLTLLAPIHPGREEELGELLQDVGDDVRGRRLEEDSGAFHIHFDRSPRIHFARFALVPDPDRGEDRHRLLYAATFDGSLREHVRELTAIVTDPDRLWGHCEGYAGVAGFQAFVRAHHLAPHACYIAFRDGSVQAVQRDLTLRRQVDALLDADPVGGMAQVEEWLAQEGRRRKRPLRRLVGLIRRGTAAVGRFLRVLPLGWDIVRAVVRFGPVTVWRSTLQILATLDRYRGVRIFNRLVRNRLPPMASSHSSLPPDRCPSLRGYGPARGRDPEELPPSHREDAVAQNQLTLLTGVEPGSLRSLGAVMAAIDSLAKRLSPPGSLTGIRTIHFVRWVIVDDGRRLLMLSDYDGTWENYIDEFAEMILSGLDAIWGGATDAPPDGARDLPAFKDFLRRHQVPPRIFYSAYPGTTTQNILSGRELARRLPDHLLEPHR